MKRLDEIEARAEAATDGPWEAKRDSYSCEAGSYEGAEIPGVAETVLASTGCDHGDLPPLEVEDADFIAHARTDVPAMIAALRAVLELADELTRFADTPATGHAENVARAVSRVNAERIRRRIADALEGERL